MSSKKARISNSDKLKLLHSVGIGKELKPTKKSPLSKSESSKVSRLWSKYDNVAKNPGAFQKVNISKFSERDQKTFNKNKYAVVGNTMYVPKEYAEKVSIKNVWTKDEDGNPIKVLKVRREYPASMKKSPTETLLHSNGLEFMDWRARILHEYENGKYPEGTVIALKVYDNSPMIRSNRIDINELLKYGEGIQWKLQGRQTVEQLQDNLHLVIIYENRDGGQMPSQGILSDRDKRRQQRKNRNSITRKNSNKKKR